MTTRFAAGLAAGLLFCAGCDFGLHYDFSRAGGREQPGPSCSPDLGTHLHLTTGESYYTTSMMLVGELGTVGMRPLCKNGQLGDPVPNASVTSRNPAIVSVSGDTLRALTLGSTVIVGRVLSTLESATVEVVPAIADRIVLGLADNWQGTEARYDSLNSLTEVSVPLHTAIIPSVKDVVLGARHVHVSSFLTSSANPAVAVVTAYCRPIELDPYCGTANALWVSGMSVGETIVSVTVRDASATASFVVKVY